MYPVIKNFSIISEIGRGPLGVVYEAVDTRIKRTVALKVFPPHLFESKGASDRFLREAKAIAKIDHPGIVGILDFGLADTGHFVAMEYIPGMNMDRLLRVKGAQRMTITAAIMREIAEGLSHVHHLGIVHGNIKPANIHFHSQGKAMLSDFDVIHYGHDFDKVEDEALAKAPFFMAPERLGGNGATAASDMYSWAVCFFWMLTGKLPYGAQRYPEIIREIKAGDVTLDMVVTADLPSRYRDMLTNCLASDPVKRIKNASELMRRFEFFKKERFADVDPRVLCGDSSGKIDAPKTAPAAQGRPEKKRPPRAPMEIRVAVGIIAVIAAIGTLAAFWFLKPRNDFAANPIQSAFGNRKPALTADSLQPNDSARQTPTPASPPQVFDSMRPMTQQVSGAQPALRKSFLKPPAKAIVKLARSTSDSVEKEQVPDKPTADSSQSILDSFNILSPESR